MLEDYNVISVAGNSEYYNTLGIEPFIYFDEIRKENQEWTNGKLSNSDLETLKLYKPSLDLTIGDQKLHYVILPMIFVGIISEKILPGHIMETLKEVKLVSNSYIQIVRKQN